MYIYIYMSARLNVLRKHASSQVPGYVPTSLGIRWAKSTVE